MKNKTGQFNAISAWNLQRNTGSQCGKIITGAVCEFNI